MSEKKDPSERLSTLLGGLPKRSGGPGVLEKAIEAVKARQAEENQEAAEKLVEQAIELQRKREGLRKQFEQNDKKAGKELGKIVGQIEALSSGQVPSDDSGEEDSES